MKVLLIQPYYKDTFADYPLGLGYIASVLEKEGHIVEFMDLTKNPLSDSEFKEHVKRINPDLVGMSVMCRALRVARRLIANINEVTDAPVVIGGVQATTMPEFTLRWTGAKFVVIGEGEKTIKELAEYIEKGKDNFNTIKGIAYLDNERKIILTEPRELIKNIDEIPFPARHIMPPASYELVPVLSTAKGYPIASLITTRGCPYQCAFCAAPTMWGRTFRRRSPKNVVDEMQLLIEKWGVREIFISDDNFTLIKEHALGVCREITQRNLDISWACPNGVRIDRLDEEVINAMKKAGCHLLGFGVESGNQEILNRAHKQLDLSLASTVIRNVKKAGITTYGFFIIGLPGETSETIKQTIKFAKSLPFDRAWFNILVPYPGTEIFNTYIKDVGLENVDWDNLDTSTGIIEKGLKYKDLTGRDLVRWQRTAVRKFYLRPKVMISVSRNLGIKQLKAMTQRSFFKKLVGKE